MLIEQAVLTELGNAAALVAIVSTRIYYVRAPQSVISPYVILSKVSASREQTHDGPAHLAYSEIQIFSFATTYTVAKEIAGIIQTTLQAFSGNMGDAPYVAVGACEYTDEVDDHDPDTNLYYVSQIFRISHYE